MSNPQIFLFKGICNHFRWEVQLLHNRRIRDKTAIMFSLIISFIRQSVKTFRHNQKVNLPRAKVNKTEVILRTFRIVHDSFSYSKKESESNDILIHSAEFLIAHSRDRTPLN